MPITDYKITDIERDAVSVEKTRPDVMDPDADITKAWFDTYPDKIRAEHDLLIDYLGTMPIAYLSSAAAATANKGSITGFVPLGAIIELSMTNGNTAVSPTVTIDGVSHAITGMPTVAQVQANSTQTYRLVKTGATALTFTKTPDYVTEYGTRASGFKYKYHASGSGNIDGDTYTPTITSLSGTITSSSSACSWSRIGDRISVDVRVLINTTGTALGYLRVSLPFASAYSVGCGGTINGATSTFGFIDTASNNQRLDIGKYEGSTVIANGNTIFTQVSYTTA